MLLDDSNSALPVFDTTLIHAKALIDFALQE
jgi:aspartate/glutamate racemase